MSFCEGSLTQIGKVTRLFGYKGEFIVQLSDNVTLDLKLIRFLFIVFLDGKCPYRVSTIKFHKKNSLLVRLVDFNTESKSQKLLKNSVKVLVECLKPTSSILNSTDFIEYAAWDIKYGYIGKIKRINRLTSQPFFEIETSSNQQVYIPRVASFIQKVNNLRKEIYFKTPMGLLDLYIKTI